MKLLILIPTNQNSLIQKDTIFKKIQNRTHIIEKVSVWLTGFFKIYVPDTQDEIYEYSTYYDLPEHIMTHDDLVEYVANPDEDLNLNNTHFEFIPYGFRELQTVSYNIKSNKNIKDEIYNDIFVNKKDIDDFIIEDGWKSHKKIFIIKNGYTILNR